MKIKITTGIIVAFSVLFLFSGLAHSQENFLVKKPIF